MPKYSDIGERIIANSVISNDSFYNASPCWIWTGKKDINRSGMPYPVMTMRYKRGPRKGKVYNARVHRESVKFFNGKRVTPRMVVLHLCNNTLCVNPAHLLGGSQKQNVRQCVKDGRHVTPFRKDK